MMLSVISKSTGRAVFILFKCNVNIKMACKCNRKQALFYSKNFGVEKFDENITEKLSYIEADDFEIIREDNFSHVKPDKINSEKQIKVPTNSEASVTAEISEFKELDIKDNNGFVSENYRSKNVLAPGLEDVSHIAPIIRPSFNFAAYADQSEILQKLLALGVDFYKLEHITPIPSYLVQLNYENDIEPYLRFLLKVGVESDQLGRFITKNSNLFKEHIDDLQVRINYLESKNFKPEAIAKIVSVNPHWLRYKVADIDAALGYFQNEFQLSGEEIRLVAAKNPKLITRDRQHLMFFDYKQLRTLYLALYQSILAYGIIHWGNAASYHLAPISYFQKFLFKKIKCEQSGSDTVKLLNVRNLYYLQLLLHVLKNKNKFGMELLERQMKKWCTYRALINIM